MGARAKAVLRKGWLSWRLGNAPLDLCSITQKTARREHRCTLERHCGRVGEGGTKKSWHRGENTVLEERLNEG